MTVPRDTPERPELDYAMVGLTLPELAAARDAVARDVMLRGGTKLDRQARGLDPLPPALESALRKLTYYHDRRAKR